MAKKENNEVQRNSIAMYLKSKRLEQGWSQNWLSRKCGVNKITIMRMEQGNHWLNLNNYISICNALNINYDEAINNDLRN